MSDVGITVNLPDGETTVFDTTLKTLKIQSGVNHSEIVQYGFSTEPTADLLLFEIEHGYSYAPMSMVFWSSDRETFYMMPSVIISDINGSREFDYETTSSGLYIYLRITDTPPSTIINNTYFFKYYITTEDGRTN